MLCTEGLVVTWQGTGVGVGVEVGVGVVSMDTLTSVSVVPVDWHVPPPDSSAVAHTAVLPCATAITFELYGLVVSMEEAFATLGLYEPNLIRRILAPAGKEVIVAEMFPWVGPWVMLRFKTDGEVVT